ncbi:hypothetical protein [Algisphaera agarilytica]|uniref:Uncharacterized protein n=1 Tax=Algisphaera agarilytica TaxID=1385975 RepID=A0A7X0H9H7_9BACT|nr:hypothetical protein [Algisphaera agarilytica]MBB6430611.1 hypothetical protein [Algisphaera agarilytica]
MPGKKADWPEVSNVLKTAHHGQTFDLLILGDVEVSGQTFYDKSI